MLLSDVAMITSEQVVVVRVLGGNYPVPRGLLYILFPFRNESGVLLSDVAIFNSL